MKASFEQIPNLEETSFLLKHFSVPFFDAPLHFHPEFELTLIVKGYGQRFVGDSIENFEAGDLVLLGANLPHFWRCDADFYQSNSDLQAEAIVCQFSVQKLAFIFDKLPEFQSINALLNQAKFGIKFSAETKQNVQKLFLQLPILEGGQRFLVFWEILYKLSQSIDYQLLTSDSFSLKPNLIENERMKRILEFTLQNFTEEIQLQQVAEVAHLTAPAFCRYFKQRTRKTYFDYVNELRINQAHKLLINSDLSISQVALDSGFQNPSHFHTQFKKAYQYSPLVYRKKMSKILLKIN